MPKHPAPIAPNKHKIERCFCCAKSIYAIQYITYMNPLKFGNNEVPSVILKQPTHPRGCKWHLRHIKKKHDSVIVRNKNNKTYFGVERCWKVSVCNTPLGCEKCSTLNARCFCLTRFFWEIVSHAMYHQFFATGGSTSRQTS